MHCDVRIFEWLFQYIHSSNGVEPTSNSSAVGTNSSETNRNASSSGDNEEGSGGKAWSSERERIDGAGPPPLEVTHKHDWRLVVVCWFVLPDVTSIHSRNVSPRY